MQLTDRLEADFRIFLVKLIKEFAKVRSYFVIVFLGIISASLTIQNIEGFGKSISRYCTRIAITLMLLDLGLAAPALDLWKKQ